MRGGSRKIPQPSFRDDSQSETTAADSDATEVVNRRTRLGEETLQMASGFSCGVKCNVLLELATEA